MWTERGCGRPDGAGREGEDAWGAPTRLPGPRALRLRWRADRPCPRPRKPPAPPAAAEPSQRLQITTAAAVVAALLVCQFLTFTCMNSLCAIFHSFFFFFLQST